jgi:long-chain acyl-CoA synthetase
MDTIISKVRERLSSYPESTIIRYKDGGRFKDISCRQLNETITLLGCALLDMGVKIGDRIAILSENRPEWAYADLAILSCGGITVPIYATDSEKDIEYILKDSGSEIIFVSDREKLEKVLPAAKNTPLRRIITFSEAPSADPLVILLKNFLKTGEKKSAQYKSALEDRLKALTAEEIATIIYTSGSTGQPKGVMLTNGNFLSVCRTSAELINIGPDDRHLSFLPLSHVFERVGGYYMQLIHGGQIAYAEDKKTVMEDARAVSPTIMLGVPRFFEKVFAEMTGRAARGHFLKKNLFFWAYKIGKACVLLSQRNRRIPPHLVIQRVLINRPIARTIKKALGGRLRYFVSGGAPLSKEVAYFFLSFDVLILEGYGLTKSTCVISVNTKEANRTGTVGRPLPGLEVRIAQDGEITAKGPTIMKGYYRSYKDAESGLKGGWLYTGDIGYIDKDGYLVITDRKKDIIVTSGGKNVAPSDIESTIKADRYIDDVMVHGDRRKFLSALVVPDIEALRRYAEFKGIEFDSAKDLADNPRIREFLMRRIEAKQKELPRFSRVRKIAVLDEPLTQSRGELTPTMKIRRKIVGEKYKEILDGLYEEDNV